jgi:hypothetical protein
MQVLGLFNIMVRDSSTKDDGSIHNPKRRATAKRKAATPEHKQ